MQNVHTKKLLGALIVVCSGIGVSSCNSSNAATIPPQNACNNIITTTSGVSCTLIHNFVLNTSSPSFSSDWIVQTENSPSNAAICANGEKELYYNSPANLSNDANGDLSISLTAPDGVTPNYHSAKLISNYLIKGTTIPHGVVEFTAKLPTYTPGAWPALWLYRYADDTNGSGEHTCTSSTISGGSAVSYKNGTWPTDGEIDIMEYIAGSSYTNLNNQMFSTLHYGQGFAAGVQSPSAQVQHRQTPTFSTLSDSFHNYAAEWNCKGIAPHFTSCRITMYLDGQVMKDNNDSSYSFETINGIDTDLDSSFQNGFNNGFNIIMNFATGGSPFGTASAANGVNTSLLPLNMTIKKVAIYQVTN